MLVGLAATSAITARPQEQFRASVEVVAIDVQVIDKQGAPVPDLKPSDFTVMFDRRPRVVKSADFIRYGTDNRERSAAGTLDREAAIKVLQEKRIFILAIDEASFRVPSAMVAGQMARRFIKRLEPGSVTAVFRYPFGDGSLNFNTDPAVALTELDKVVGRLMVPKSEFHLTASEVVDINTPGRSGAAALQRVVQRECPNASAMDNCPQRLRGEATSLAGYMEGQVAQSLAGLKSLLETLAGIPARKTLIVISGGLMAGDAVGSRPDLRSVTQTVGELAASSNVRLYALHATSSFDDLLSEDRGASKSSVLRDDMILGLALEMFTGAAGGTVIPIRDGLSDFAFDRILRETSAYYLLGVTPDDRDRDGKPHFVDVKVNRRGVEAHARAQVIIPKR